MATFQIHEDQENDENIRRLQKETQVHVQQQKRSVLGILTNNFSRQPISKPSKPDLLLRGKQKTDEVKSSFSVYSDEAPAREDNKEVKKPVKNESVFDLPAALYRLPLQDISSKNEGCHTPVHSPMVIDKSCEFKKPVKDTEEKVWTTFMGFAEYFDDIYKYLRYAERRSRAKSNYMKQQPDINASMRSILVDWLVEVAEEYKLQTESLYLAVSYIDRFLSYMSVRRAKLQLVGTAAMFIATKYEEVFPPDVNEFAFITDDTYTKKTVLQMEQMILKVLSFDLSTPTVLTFLNIYSEGALKCVNNSMDNHDRETIFYLAMFLSELSLVEGEPYLQFLPSTRAAAALALARFTLDWTPAWPDDLQKPTGYKVSDLMPCISCLEKTYRSAAGHQQQAVREKYKSNRWHNVSLLTPRSDNLC